MHNILIGGVEIGLPSRYSGFRHGVGRDGKFACLWRRGLRPQTGTHNQAICTHMDYLVLSMSNEQVVGGVSERLVFALKPSIPDSLTSEQSRSQRMTRGAFAPFRSLDYCSNASHAGARYQSRCPRSGYHSLGTVHASRQVFRHRHVACVVVILGAAVQFHCLWTVLDARESAPLLQQCLQI